MLIRGNAGGWKNADWQASRQEQEVCARCSKPLAPGVKTCSIENFSVIVRAVAVDLAADFAARPECAVYVHVSRTRTHRPDQLVDFTGVDSLGSRRCGSRDIRTYVRSQYRARDRGWRRRTWLNSRWTITKIGAEENADTAIYAL